MDVTHNYYNLSCLVLVVFIIATTYGVEVRLDKFDGCISQECQVQVGFHFFFYYLFYPLTTIMVEAY